MKKIVILLLLLGSFLNGFSQDNFTLTFELVKPSGKIDNEAYFLARLKNNNDSLSMLVGLKGFKFMPEASYFRVVYDKIGEPEYSSDEKPFFDFYDKRYVLIGPASEYQVRCDLYLPFREHGNGILPLFVEALRKVKRVRIKLENFQFTPIMVGVIDSNHLYCPKTIDLYSNWLNINGEDFVPELKRRVGVGRKPKDNLLKP